MKKRTSNRKAIRKTILRVEALEERIVFSYEAPTDMTALALEDYPNGPPSSPATRIVSLNRRSISSSPIGIGSASMPADRRSRRI